MSDLLHSEHSHHGETAHSLTPILSVADFDGSGDVDFRDIFDLISRYDSVDGEDKYHPLYDLNTNGKIDFQDIIEAVKDYGEDVPLVDQQIALATQATMKYYGSDGLENAIADGYIPFTQEAKGHGIHYYNPALANEIANSEELDIERPVGLNYDLEGNLIAVFYIRIPDTQEATSENPLGEFLVDPTDDFPPSSFDSLPDGAWHHHQSAWITGVGNLNSEEISFEEDVPLDTVVSRAQQIDFQLFPESDRFYLPKFWMLHGWFHSFNPEGAFAINNPDAAPYAPEELGAHIGHNEQGEHTEGHQGEMTPLITGTDLGEQLLGTEENERINGFGGDDWIAGGLGDDSIWGSQGNDWIRGEDALASSGGDDMLYGGPGNDLIYGNMGSDRLFGGTEDDRLNGGVGDDLMRGGLGYDILTGGEGADSFVLVAGEGTDLITDLELESDTIILYGGITTETISLEQLNSDAVISFNNETLAIIKDITVDDLMVASDDVFLVA